MLISVMSLMCLQFWSVSSRIFMCIYVLNSYYPNLLPHNNDRVAKALLLFGLKSTFMIVIHAIIICNNK